MSTVERTSRIRDLDTLLASARSRESSRVPQLLRPRISLSARKVSGRSCGDKKKFRKDKGVRLDVPGGISFWATGRGRRGAAGLGLDVEQDTLDGDDADAVTSGNGRRGWSAPATRRRAP